MFKKCPGETFPELDWAAWPVSLALALLAAGATLVTLTGDLAAQGAGQNSVKAQIQRYGCNLPQYANSVAACRELHARARTKKSGRATVTRVRQAYSGSYTRTPSPPRTSSGGGFFSSLFGSGKSSRRTTVTASASRSGGSIFGTNGWSGTYPARLRGGGRYRTLCVRTCDGYYWPVSFSTTRSGFSRDAKQCASSCAVPAKLFVHRNPGADVQQMVDLGGQPYSRMENAFRYRTEYVKECRCKPEPWSDEAKKDYATRVAQAEAPAPVKTAAAEQAVAPVATAAPEASSAPAPRAVNRKKARWRERSDEANFSGQWWASSW